MENIEVSKLLVELNVDPRDNYQRSVAKSLSFVQPGSNTYKIIEESIQSTHSPVHNQYKIELVKLFSINSPYDKRFYNHKIGNWKLLFHGTEDHLVYPILCEGYRIKIASEHGLFGRGIYFTNCSSKAANYTSPDSLKLDGAADEGTILPKQGGYGYVFLSQVALGKCSSYTKKPNTKDHGILLKGMNSVFGEGQLKPQKRMLQIKDDEVEAPIGPLERFYDENECHLLQDEHAIYKCDRVRHRFLLVLEFLPSQ